jgi:hypothetical protein
MDSSDPSTSVHGTIASGLECIGMPDLPCRHTTFLIRDGHGIGRRFVFEGIQAVWLMEENAVRFYDEEGRMLKRLEVGAAERNEAA